MNRPTTISAPLRTRIRAEQKEVILGAAEEVFAANGLQAGRMDLVAARAGVSVGTLYNYFGDRESLLRTLLATRREELLDRVDRALLESDGTFRARLRAFLDATFAHCRAHRAFLSLFLQEEAAALKAKLEPPRGFRTLELLNQRASAITAQGVDEGQLRKGDAEFWARLLVGAMHAAMVEELSLETSAPGRDVAGEIYDFFLTGAVAPETGPR